MDRVLCGSEPQLLPQRTAESYEQVILQYLRRESWFSKSDSLSIILACWVGVSERGASFGLLNHSQSTKSVLPRRLSSHADNVGNLYPEESNPKSHCGT